MGAQVDAAARAGSRCGAARWPLQGHHARLQPHPRRRDDAGRDGAVRRRPDAADATSPAGASRKPTASPRWPPNCASSAPRWSKAPTSSTCSRAGALAAPQRSTPTTTTAWRCASRWPPSTRWPAPPAVPVRIHDPQLRRQDLPRLLRGAVRRRHAAAAERSRCITIDGPTASGKGTLAAARGAGAGLPPARLRRALPRHRPGRAARRRGAGRRSRPGARWPPTLDLRFGDGQQSASAARTSATRCALEAVGALASQVSALPAVRAGAARLQLASAALPGPGGRRARHGHGGLPRRRRSRCSSPRAPPRAPSGAISS